MTKNQIIVKIEHTEIQLEEISALLEDLSGEDRVISLSTPPVLTYLKTAADYLNVNLTEIKNRVRMT